MIFAVVKQLMLKVNQTASGTYHCTASNGIGSPDTRSVVVTVRGESFLFYLSRNFSIISRFLAWKATEITNTFFMKVLVS